jgi:hypothetical protein
MKQKRRTVKDEEEPVDDLSLPDDVEILTRGKKVMLKPKRGGALTGAGRKPKGHLRMQVLVSKRAKDKIRRLAKDRGSPCRRWFPRNLRIIRCKDLSWTHPQLMNTDALHYAFLVG